MKKFLLFAFLLGSGIIATHRVDAQATPSHRIPVVPPRVLEAYDSRLALILEGVLHASELPNQYFVEKGVFRIVTDYTFVYFGRTVHFLAEVQVTAQGVLISESFATIYV